MMLEMLPSGHLPAICRVLRSGIPARVMNLRCSGWCSAFCSPLLLPKACITLAKLLSFQGIRSR